MSKTKSGNTQGTMLDETVTPAKTTEAKKTAEPKISIDCFVSLKQLAWTVRARLDHYVQVQKLDGDMTIKQWENLLRKI